MPLCKIATVIRLVNIAEKVARSKTSHTAIALWDHCPMDQVGWSNAAAARLGI